MNKKILTIGLAILIITIAGAATVSFIFPYLPLEPPIADDTGHSEEGIQAVVQANNKFAFDFYHELAKIEEENIFYSPYSISSALAITYEGAKGRTAEEIQSVFHFPEIDDLRPNFAAIYNQLNKRRAPYELRTGNALWAQQDYPFLGDYLNNVERYYGAKAANLDFVRETESSRQTINRFIEEQTSGRIDELLKENDVNPLTVLVITNAIYFKGDWLIEFDEANTMERNFYITPDDVVQVPMMSMDPKDERFNYVQNEKLEMLELPYLGEEISMIIILPKENIESIESELKSENIEILVDKMSKIKLGNIQIPKFEFNTEYYLHDVLKDMGMPTAFESESDFSKMIDSERVVINDVIHNAFVKVDEKGTEAAAATAVTIERVSAVFPTTFIVDRPFIFMIRHRETGNILFLGRVVDPST